MSRPFRAIWTIPVPRALPWAAMFWPFQGKPNIYPRYRRNDEATISSARLWDTTKDIVIISFSGFKRLNNFAGNDWVTISGKILV
nr:hypothetical protein [Desulfobulbaceae bacterium]